MAELRLIGDPILGELIPEIEDLTAPLVKEAMGAVVTTLVNSSSLVGLAANQVGYAVRLFALKENGSLRVYFNPSIIRSSYTMVTDIEGCGSIPDRRFMVERFATVVARWQMPTGKLKAEQMHDKQARAYQHELDHLNGILISDIGEEVTDERLPATVKSE